MKAHHDFSHSHVEHHGDGSHTIHHVHKSGDPTKDVKHAVQNLDGVHDSMQANLGAPNPGEAAPDAGAASGVGAPAPGALPQGA